MAQLQTLDGQPLSWDELLRRNAEWHATHDRHGGLLPDYGCAVCTHSHHAQCTGRSADGECACALRGHAA